MNPTLILASQSPRRRLLLTQAGYDFLVQVPSPEAECGICSNESPSQFVARQAWRKARDVAQSLDIGMVIGCDTVAECRGQILGKPLNREHADQMLRIMRGQIHHVYSGLCLWRRPENATQVQVDITRLRMDDFSEDVLQLYLDSDAWEGKAGAFGYQDGLDWVHIEEGSESNVVGLPLELLATMLAKAQDELDLESL